MKRTYDEMMKLIMDFAETDERIRAVTMEGSRANSHALHDDLSDFDICYYVRDIRDFTGDRSFLTCFGDILIMQMACDTYDEPYDYNSREVFNYMMQFTDGNRIDLTFKDLSHIDEEPNNTEPRLVLLNKDDLPQLFPLESEECFYTGKPDEKEYFDTCNEFRWLSLYVIKGLLREQLYYAKYIYDVLMVKMFMKMINWKVAIENNFSVTTGASSKYLKNYLTAEEMERFASVFPNGDYEDIWSKLFVMYDYFAELAAFVAANFGFTYDEFEAQKVREFLKQRDLLRQHHPE